MIVAKDFEDAKRFLKKIEQGKIGNNNSKIIVEKNLQVRRQAFFMLLMVIPQNL